MPDPVVFDGMSVEYSDNAATAPAAAAPVEQAPAPIQVEEPVAIASVEDNGSESDAGGTATETQSAPTTYKYGDRDLTADELHKEVTQNLLPDYTRKSQELSKYKSGGDINHAGETQEPVKPAEENKPWKDPNWVPETYADVVKIATEEAKVSLQQEQAQAAAASAAAEAQVNATLSELKAKDPGLNEDLLFAHLNKYGFTDMKLGYLNYRETQQAVRQASETAAANVRKRQEDPIAGKTGVVSADDGYDPSAVGRFDNALDALHSIKG